MTGQDAHQTLFEAAAALDGIRSMLTTAGDTTLEHVKAFELDMLLAPICEKISATEQYLAQPST